MKGNDVYEHLAKVYLDEYSNRKKRYVSKPFRDFVKFGMVIVIAFVIVISISLFWQNSPSQSKEETIIIEPQINRIKIGNFNQSTKGIVTYNLIEKDIDFFDYKTLTFLARKSNYKDKILMRIELVDNRGNQSIVYVDGLPTYTWKEFQIKLGEFKEINTRSDISLLAFVIEDWKTKRENAALYIDNVRLLK